MLFDILLAYCAKAMSTQTIWKANPVTSQLLDALDASDASQCCNSTLYKSSSGL